MGFTDTHVHFHFPDYDADRAKTIDAARQAGVELFINVGTDIESSRKSLALAEEFPDFYASAGIHPHDAHVADPAMLQEIEKILQHPRMVAIGEVGLDFFRDHSPRVKQEEVFRHFLKLHHKIKKPMIIHCRDAYEDMHCMLKEENVHHGIMHCFSSDRAAMEKFVEMGFHISFAGPLTYKKNDALREACKACPKDRLLLETDAPFLPPQSMRGKRNESAYLLEIARTAAELHQVSLEELGKITTANAKKVLKLC
jgi:TatD DNase family protein